MNKLDSELVISQLCQLGFCYTDNADDADIIIFNTCSVRHHAEEKALTKISQLRKRYNNQPGLIVAVIGCMAQRLGQELLDKYKQVSIVCGPGQLHKLGQMIQRAIPEDSNRERTLALNNPDEYDDLEQLDVCRQPVSFAANSFMAFLRIMRGCNNYCSYCVVPHVRGHEHSRPLKNIVIEARRLVENGVKEITLLGQTVNSYKYKDGGEVFGLADVLGAVGAIDGLKRLRFVTSYPRNFDERILQVMAKHPKVCPYLHMPAQSGSDRILAAMNRRYTSEEYLQLIARARQIVPELTIAGDFIVGFPGETDEDHQETLNLLRQVRYKSCFVFKYSPRYGTRAYDSLADDVPAQVKQQRLAQLLELQNKISLDDNQRFVNHQVEILVEGPSKNPQLNRDAESPAIPSVPQLVGRTTGDHIVVFSGQGNLTGQIVRVKVVRASALTLFAEGVMGLS
jgi:tRNA-2-methylthio-N6-dimethylallyladenosine synthase